MYEKFTKLSSEAVGKLKNSLLREQIALIKAELIKIYNNASSTTVSFNNIERSEMFDESTVRDVKYSFYFLANHLAVPRAGATVFLRDAFEEENPEISFPEYQQEIMGIIYQHIQGL